MVKTREQRVEEINNGMALCGLDNHRGASDFAKEQQVRYIEGFIDRNTFIKEMVEHHKVD